MSVNLRLRLMLSGLVPTDATRCALFRPQRRDVTWTWTRLYGDFDCNVSRPHIESPPLRQSKQQVLPPPPPPPLLEHQDCSGGMELSQRILAGARHDWDAREASWSSSRLEQGRSFLNVALDHVKFGIVVHGVVSFTM